MTDDLTPDQIDGPLDLIDAETIVHDPHRYAFTQIVAAKLWRDEAQRDAFAAFLAAQPTPGFVRTDDEHAVAASFGQLVHSPDCTRSLQSMPTQTVGECTEECVIMPCEEADASVVLIRVEINARTVDHADT